MNDEFRTANCKICQMKVLKNFLARAFSPLFILFVNGYKAFVITSRPIFLGITALYNREGDNIPGCIRNLGFVLFFLHGEFRQESIRDILNAFLHFTPFVLSIC